MEQVHDIGLRKLWSGQPTEQMPVTAADFYIPVIVVFVGNFLFFFWCQYKKDNSYIDSLWGLTFMSPIISIIIKRLVTDSPNPGARVYIVLGLVSIWGVRLCLHIAKRHRDEDFRYKKMRADWTKAGGGYKGYLWRAFLYVFMLQALFSVISNAAALYVAIYSASDHLIWLDFLGIAVWVFGFLFECIGDYQLKVHIADKTEGKKKFINSGLWKYTRHPNYFGEATLWWGIYLIACAIEWGWISFFAPAFITYLVRFLSGVPMLEEKYKGNREWEAYCAQVNVFVPWFPNKKAGLAAADPPNPNGLVFTKVPVLKKADAAPAESNV